MSLKWQIKCPSISSFATKYMIKNMWNNTTITKDLYNIILACKEKDSIYANTPEH